MAANVSMQAKPDPVALKRSLESDEPKNEVNGKRQRPAIAKSANGPKRDIGPRSEPKAEVEIDDEIETVAGANAPETADPDNNALDEPKLDGSSRAIEALEECILQLFQEDDQLSENDAGQTKLSLFRRIPQIHGQAIAMSKRGIRRIRGLLSACTPTRILQSIPDDTMSRIVGLLTAAVEVAGNMGLEDMLKSALDLASDAELSSDFCQRLDLALSVSCLGLEAASLIIDLAATGRVIATLFADTGASLNSRLQALLACILAAYDPIVALAGLPTLPEQDVISLVFASITITFSTSELLGVVVDANTFESIRRAAQSLLRQVFEFHVDQRTWMLEEILASLIRLPTQKRSQKAHRISGGKSVQFITVLLLKLLQGTAHSPEDLTAGFEGGALSAKEYRIMLQKHTKSVETAFSNTDFTVRYLISRCVKRDSKATANEAEYRALLESFIEDCIALLGHPQWPASELVVRIYSLHILELLDEEKSDISMKTLALDSAAQVASHIAQAQRDYEALVKSSGGVMLESINPSSSLEAVNRFHETSASLLEYLQSKATGGESTGAIPLYVSGWATSLIATLLKWRRRKGGASKTTNDQSVDDDDDDDDDDEDDGDGDGKSGSGSRANINGTSSNSDSDSESDSDSDSDSGKDCNTRSTAVGNGRDRAHDVSGSKCGPEKRKAIQSCLKDYMAITHRSTRAMLNHVTNASATDSAKALFLIMPLYRSFDMLLTQVIMALSASQVTLRSKAMRALNLIASHRPSVLYQANVKYAINHRLQDSSPQVREAAIDLIGKHIAQNPELTDQYYEFISVRVLDKGPSVRKRVLKILRDIYVSSSDLSQLVDIGVRMLQRTGDDERSIRELATKTLHELWFTSQDHTVIEDEDGARDATSGNVFNLLSPESQREMLKRVRVMTGVMEASRSREMSDLMAEIFEHVTTKSTNAEADVALLVIRCVIDALFEQLLRSEETGSDVVDSEGANDVYAAKATSSAMFSTAACLRFISALSAIAPDAVGQHAEMLSAYLKMTSAAEEDMLFNVLTIISNTLLYIPHPSTQFLGALEADLFSLLSSSPQSILSIVVPCLCTLIEKLTWNYGKLIRMFRSCVLQLYREHRRIAGGAATGAMSAKNLMRFVMLSGMTCRHFDFDQYREEYAEHFKDLEQIIKGTVPDFMNSTLLFFAAPPLPPSVQLAAIQMLGQLYIKQPRLALEPQARLLMDRVFAGEGVGHKLQVVRNLFEFLRADAKRYAERQKKESGKTREIDAKALVGNTGDMSEAGVGASLMQTYLDRVIDATFLSGSAPLRAAGFEVMSLVLEQGLAHPLKCVPALIALGTSSDAYIRNKSLKLHQDLCFKYASFIHSRDIEGVRLAYDYQVQIRGKAELVVGYSDSADVRDLPDRPVAHLQPLYSQLRSKRVRRNEFLALLVKTGDYDFGVGGGSGPSIDVSFTRFVAENLASLDYKYLDEVLHVIYQISAVMAGTGLNLYHQFEASGGTGAANGSGVLSVEQATEASACVGVMFALREFLKVHYNISEARCLSYNPSDSAGVRDKPVTWHHAQQGGGGQGRIEWDACNPFAVKRMESADDYEKQRAVFQRMMAGSLAAAEEESEIGEHARVDVGSENRSFDGRNDVVVAGSRALAAVDYENLDPDEELELLNMDDFDDA
ncbi:Sister chromatid cohesion protein 2 [Coemansia sp. Benny D115]|nr:Sister chromatid cohesion protein 2 [Coemansia sp. Benny D115]